MFHEWDRLVRLSVGGPAFGLDRPSPGGGSGHLLPHIDAVNVSCRNMGRRTIAESCPTFSHPFSLSSDALDASTISRKKTATQVNHCLGLCPRFTGASLHVSAEILNVIRELDSYESSRFRPDNTYPRIGEALPAGQAVITERQDPGLGCLFSFFLHYPKHVPS